MDNQKQYSLLMEAFNAVYDNISESHFKVGDEVVCKKSGMEGEVVKLDKPDGKEDEKYYTVKREDGKKVKYSPNELKLAEEAKNGGVPKKKEEKFHTKLDKLVHSTFGSSPEEEKMKEEVEINEDAGIVSGLVGLALGAKGAYNAAKKSKRMRDYPKNFVKGIADPRTYVPQKKKEQKEEFDIFDVILEYLVAEGYADTNQAALAIMANMSEEWKQSIVESIARGSAPNSPSGTIGGAAGRVAGTLLQRGAELIKKNMPQSGGGYSKRPGDGKPYRDGPLWDGPKTPVKTPVPQRKPQGAPMRDEPLW